MNDSHPRMSFLSRSRHRLSLRKQPPRLPGKRHDARGQQEPRSHGSAPHGPCERQPRPLRSPPPRRERLTVRTPRSTAPRWGGHGGCLRDLSVRRNGLFVEGRRRKAKADRCQAPREMLTAQLPKASPRQPRGQRLSPWGGVGGGSRTLPAAPRHPTAPVTPQHPATRPGPPSPRPQVPSQGPRARRALQGRGGAVRSWVGAAQKGPPRGGTGA